MSGRTTRAHLAAVVFVVAFSLAPSPQAGAGAEEPASNAAAEFSFDAYGGALRVPVTFNAVAYNFLLDTGSAVSAFDPTLSSLLIETLQKSRLSTENGTRVLSLYRSPEGKIGQVRLPSLERVHCIDLGAAPFPLRKLHGCLGTEAMRSYILRVDYDRGKVAFLRSVPRDAGVRVELDKRNDLTAIQGTVGGSVRTLVLDTGGRCYGAGLIARRGFGEMLARRELVLVGTVPARSAFGMDLRRVGVATVPLSIAGYRHAALSFAEGADDSDECTLGVGYLRRYILTFDFPNYAVYFAPGAQFRRVDASFDPGGVMLRRDGERVVVYAVAGAAEKAGVKVNDILEAVNARDAAKLDDIALTCLLSKSDRPTSMDFRRATDAGIIRFVYDVQAELQRMLHGLNGRTQTAETASPANGGTSRAQRGLFGRFRKRSKTPRLLLGEE